MHNALRHGTLRGSPLSWCAARRCGIARATTASVLTRRRIATAFWVLRTMEQRARLIGGQLKVNIAPGAGVTVICSVPEAMLGKN